MTSGQFQYPFFYNYPPYFTLQPIKETRDKQINLWCSLILQYCQHTKVCIIPAAGEFELFRNDSIDRRLNEDAKRVLLESLVTRGQGLWLSKNQSHCLVLWKKLDEWANTIYNFAQSYGLQDSVMTLAELSSGDDVRGTELEGLHREIILRALTILQEKGKARLFKGATPEEEGVKFT